LFFKLRLLHPKPSRVEKQNQEATCFSKQKPSSKKAKFAKWKKVECQECQAQKSRAPRTLVTEKHQAPSSKVLEECQAPTIEK
jgi:hypothetical protein